MQNTTRLGDLLTRWFSSDARTYRDTLVAALDALVSSDATPERLIRSLETKGGGAYCLRCEGMPWDVVALNIGSPSIASATNGARQFAKMHALPWPIPTKVKVPSIPEFNP